MEYQIQFSNDATKSDLTIFSAFKSDKKTILIKHWDKSFKDLFENLKSSKQFKGNKSEDFLFNSTDGMSILAWGLGEKTKITKEILRKEFSKIFSKTKNSSSETSIYLNHFNGKLEISDLISLFIESIELTNYKFDKYKSTKSPITLKKINLIIDKKYKTRLKSLYKVIDEKKCIINSVNIGRDFINEAPNILNSESFAKKIAENFKNSKHVKVKVSNKQQIKKENMNLLLAVNAGSNYEPRFVQLDYTPSRKKGKHIVLVGKGLTFDTGGYSLKPSKSMVNMKFDMAGAATMFSIFKACSEIGVTNKITCLLGITDNAISSKATMPDSIIKSRSGKTVEILNTDAEGRLVLADLLDFASDLKPDYIIDCATLTGAVVVALGSEVGGLFGNNKKLNSSILASANKCDEYLWELPIIDEFRKDIESECADLKNTGSTRYGGSAKAAAFLEQFVKNNIPWAHLDIAGVADAQSHLPYCPRKGASGLMIRSIIEFIKNA